ncbi:MAG: hypothetical protein JO121_07290 [Deltaproteobacteria bacterium]|jgi:DNA-directed RNA polymerase subunit F|nr:hypothetical protein [Deltaproteobacteria bacterium]
MSKTRGENRRRSTATLAELFEEVAPDEIDEAREELWALGVDPSAAAERLEEVALRSIRERILREHSDTARARTGRRAELDFTYKLN